MATTAPPTSLPPDLFDQTTIIALSSLVALVAAAVLVSRAVLPAATPSSLRFLFVWHAFDALCHFVIEGSFLYHTLFSYLPLEKISAKDIADNKYFLTHNWLGYTDRVYGPQAAPDNLFGKMWMVYARADKRWGGAEVSVVSLELLTVFVVGPMAVLVCYDIVKRNPRANISMIILATAELYGTWMTFCPEWLVYNVNLDGSNWMYLWLYLFFFNFVWVAIPSYAIYVSISDISNAFAVRAKSLTAKKGK